MRHDELARLAPVVAAVRLEPDNLARRRRRVSERARTDGGDGRLSISARAADIRAAAAAAEEDGGLAADMARERAAAHAAIAERTLFACTTAAAAYDARAHELRDEGLRALARDAAYDTFYGLLSSRDTAQRRAYMDSIEAHLARRYRLAYENEGDPQVKIDMLIMFAVARLPNEVGSRAQAVILHMAVYMEASIKNHFCPPPPPVHELDAIDRALVDREVFTVYEQSVLPNAVRHLLDGKTLSVPLFIEHLLGVYRAYLSGDVVRKARAPHNRRRIIFPDDDDDDDELEEPPLTRARLGPVHARRAGTASAPPLL